MQWVVAITIFRVTTHGMSHICRMNANLVLASRLQFELHQGMLRGPVHHMEVRNGIFTSIIHR